MGIRTRKTVDLGGGSHIGYDPGTGEVTLVIEDTTVLTLTTSSNPFAPTDAAVTATGAEINAAADVSGRLVDIGDNTAYTVLAANSGKPHVIPNLTGDLTISLPAAAAGLEYPFIYAGVAADAQDWIIDTGSDTNFYLGGLVHLDTDAGSAGDEIVPVAGNGSSDSKVTVLTPEPGTEVRLVCDGTNWYLSGAVASATVPSFAGQ